MRLGSWASSQRSAGGGHRKNSKKNIERDQRLKLHDLSNSLYIVEFKSTGEELVRIQN